MRKKTITISLIVLAVVFGILFCVVQNQNRKNDNSKGTVTIGAILPLTGDAASYGTSLKRGLDIAFSGYDVRLYCEDSKGDPKTAVNAVNKLINVDKVELLIGDMFTNTTMAIIPIASKNNILLLTPTASSSEVSEKGKTAFRLYPSEAEEGEELYSFSNKLFPDKKGSIIVVNENAMLKVAKVINKNNNKQIIEYSKGLVDFTPIIQKIDKNTEVVFLIGYFEENVRLIKQSIEMKKEFSFIGLSTLYTPQLSSTLGIIDVPIFISAPKSSLDTTNSHTADYIQKYRLKYKDNPDIWSGYGYDAGNIVLKIVKDSKENGTSYIDEMYNIVGYEGVTGTTTINKDRSINKTMDMVEYNDGKFNEIKY